MKTYWRILILFYLAMAGISTAANAAEDLAFLKLVDTPHPMCEEPNDLNIASDYFVPIANDLPGARDYNELIRLRAKKDWEIFDLRMATFLRIFENSPLREAASFLWVQSKFDRVANESNPDFKETEKVLREALLLYPKSELAPVISATAAGFWLNRRLFERSLSLYQVARNDYPFHPLNCVFQMGIAESSFMMRDFKVAESAFNLVLQKCKNRRLRAGAKLRLADLAIAQNKPGGDAKAASLYDQTYKGDVASVTRYYPNALHNLGELRYRTGEYARAKFFFKEYLRTRGNEAKCSPPAFKRLADIAFRQDAKKELVTGLYLEAHEHGPNTDYGIFSRLHGLLLGIDAVPAAEFDRRLKVVDEDLEKITDRSLKTAGYLEKGLILLNTGREAALDYLVRLNDKNDFNLKQGPLSKFVRAKLFSLLEKKVARETAPIDEDNSEVEKAEESPRNKKDLLLTLEKANEIWLKNTPLEAKLRGLNTSVILNRFDNFIRVHSITDAIDLMDYWTKSPLYPKKIRPLEREHISRTLVRSLFNPKNASGFADTYLKRESTVRAFMGPELAMFWPACVLELGDEVKIQALLKNAKRSPAAIAPKEKPLPTELRDYFRVVSGELQLKMKKGKEADAILSKVKTPPFAARAMEDRFNYYKTSQQFTKAYGLGHQLLGNTKIEEQKDRLNALYDITSQGKLWPKAPELLARAKKVGIEKKDLAPFYFLAGKASFELAQCKAAIPNYESALSLDPISTDSAEARYRLGKCFVKVQQPTQARKVWADLVGMKDTFWSPMAQNELRIMKP